MKVASDGVRSTDLHQPEAQAHRAMGLHAVWLAWSEGAESQVLPEMRPCAGIMMSADAEHIPAWQEVADGAGDWVGWLTPQGELEESELGERVTNHLVRWDLIAAYSTEQDRARSGATKIFADVAEATSRRGLPFPPEWWPPSAGEMPERLRKPRKHTNGGNQ